MKVTIAVVAYNAAATLRACLDSLQAQPSCSTGEILVIDGNSTDETRTIAASYGPPVRVVDNPDRHIAAGRNVALREARHPLLAFTDADCVVPPGWLSQLLAAYGELKPAVPELAAVGGGNLPPPDPSSFQQALGLALASPLGCLGSVQGARVTQARPVISLACLNVLYETAALQAVGGFDEDLRNMCEDADVNYRLRRAGYRLYSVPEADVWHHARPTLTRWCRNMLAYGAGRARLIRKHRSLFSPAYLLALVFLPVLFAATLVGLAWWPPALLCWLHPVLLWLAGAGEALRQRAPQHAIRVGLILVCTHYCYAAGLVRGLLPGAK